MAKSKQQKHDEALQREARWLYVRATRNLRDYNASVADGITLFHPVDYVGCVENLEAAIKTWEMAVPDPAQREQMLVGWVL